MKNKRDLLTPPAQVAPLVAVLGIDDTIEFLLAFGGTEFYFPRRLRAGHPLVQMFGAEKAAELARVGASLPARMPLAKPWIAAVWASRDLPQVEIARRLHVADKTVRAWFNQDRPRDPPQLELPL